MTERSEEDTKEDSTGPPQSLWLTQWMMECLTRRISSCMRCFFVSRVEPSGFSLRVQRSLYRASKLGFRCNVVGSTGGSMFVCVGL